MKRNRGKGGGESRAQSPESGERNPQPATRNPKKRILFLEYFPFIAGGQNVLLSIIKNLRDKYDIEVLIFNRGEIEEKLKDLRIKCHHIQAPQKVKYRYFWEFFSFNGLVKQFLSRGDYDLVYSSGYFATKLISPAIKQLKIPLVWHKHQIIEKWYFSYLASQVRHFSKFACKIICVSEASKRSLQRAGVEPGKLVTVHNGVEIPSVDRGKQRAGIRKKYGIKNEFVAGTVGFFRRNKGLGLLIAAAEKLKGRDIKFLLVGKASPSDTGYEDELRKMVRDRGLERQVIFAGFQDKFKYLPAFDIFVLPSYNEPFALSVLEALGCGVPVVAFNSGGTPEAVRDGFNGYIAGNISAGSLVEKIEEAINDKEIKILGKNAAALIKKEFTIKKQMEQINGIIQGAVK
jgi:glycosyltransferase involved in cell wall biosynthesis